ncbi:hypothetical protein [Myxococcus xanthus]|nr:hypothetical protein [Myxococcus xanthus]
MSDPAVKGKDAEARSTQGAAMTQEEKRRARAAEALAELLDDED